VIARQS
jgi:hypothetical protein